jgi:hypothetical protein
VQSELDTRANGCIVVKPGPLLTQRSQFHVQLLHVVAQVIVSTCRLCAISHLFISFNYSVKFAEDSFTYVQVFSQLREK